MRAFLISLQEFIMRIVNPVQLHAVVSTASVTDIVVEFVDCIYLEQLHRIKYVAVEAIESLLRKIQVLKCSKLV